jgi:hypothetical protein
MKLVVETNCRSIVNSISDLPEGVSAEIHKASSTRDMSIDPYVIVVFTLISNIAINIFSNWLYELIKNEKEIIIRINRKSLPIDKDEITKIVKEMTEEFEG